MASVRFCVKHFIRRCFALFYTASWASAGFFLGVGKCIGVARIFSGAHFFTFFPRKKLTAFLLVVALKTQAKTTK